MIIYYLILLKKLLVTRHSLSVVGTFSSDDEVLLILTVYSCRGAHFPAVQLDHADWFSTVSGQGGCKGSCGIVPYGFAGSNETDSVQICLWLQPADSTTMTMCYIFFESWVSTGVSVKFLMVGETNSMVGYHLMAEDHSIQLGVWGAL